MLGVSDRRERAEKDSSARAGGQAIAHHVQIDLAAQAIVESQRSAAFQVALRQEMRARQGLSSWGSGAGKNELVRVELVSGRYATHMRNGIYSPETS